jgi:hypothetical protein
MARDLETIKAELVEQNPTLSSGDRVFDTDEYNETINAWANEIRNQELDTEANGYKTDRQMAYPPISEQLDKLWHDINNGTLDNTGAFFTALNTVKTDNPKPGE